MTTRLNGTPNVAGVSGPTGREISPFFSTIEYAERRAMIGTSTKKSRGRITQRHFTVPFIRADFADVRTPVARRAPRSAADR